MKVGDKVLVVDAEQLYIRYTRFFYDEEIENSDWKIRYAYGKENIDTNIVYEILYISENGNDVLIAEAENNFGNTYIINIRGLVLKDYSEAESYVTRLNNVFSKIKVTRSSNISDSPIYKIEFSDVEAYCGDVDFGHMFNRIVHGLFGKVYLEYCDNDIYVSFEDVDGFVDFGKWFFGE